MQAHGEFSETIRSLRQLTCNEQREALSDPDFAYQYLYCIYKVGLPEAFAKARSQLHRIRREDQAKLDVLGPILGAPGSRGATKLRELAAENPEAVAADSRFLSEIFRRDLAHVLAETPRALPTEELSKLAVYDVKDNFSAAAEIAERAWRDCDDPNLVLIYARALGQSKRPDMALAPADKAAGALGFSPDPQYERLRAVVRMGCDKLYLLAPGWLRLADDYWEFGVALRPQLVHYKMYRAWIKSTVSAIRAANGLSSDVRAVLRNLG